MVLRGRCNGELFIEGGVEDRNKSLLSCDVLVLNYEWIGWEFVCVMEWVGGGGVWMIDCRRVK